jgi:hypothetical protein
MVGVIACRDPLQGSVNRIFEVIARCKPQHRAQDFVAFLRDIEATIGPTLDIVAAVR